MQAKLSPPADCAGVNKMEQNYTTLAETARALRSGEVNAQALLEAARERHQDRGEQLNAYLVWADEMSGKAAVAADAAFSAGRDLGLLQGLPVSFKDHYGIEGLPTYAGTSKRLPEKWEREGPVVKAAKQQLTVITGKTHSVEFAASGMGDNLHWGAPRNPWDASFPRGVGGSSSGAAISLWEESSLVSFGTDTRGSVRIPSAMSGVVGLKITLGRWSCEHIVPLEPSRDTPGPLTRSVKDSAYVFSALDPKHKDAPHSLLSRLESAELTDFRIGVADDCFWDGCSPGIAEGARQALAELESAGARQHDVHSSEACELEQAFTKGRFLMPDLFAFIEAELPEWSEQLEPRLAKSAERVQRLLATDHLKSKMWAQSLAATADRCFDDVDVIACPTVPRTPPVLIDGVPSFEAGEPPEYICARNTCLANFFGWCAITLPVGLDALGMPVGLQFLARGGTEETLLAVALAAERTLGDVRSRLGTPPLLA